MKPLSVGEVVKQAYAPKEKPKVDPPEKYHHGDRVTHAVHGNGIVIGEWGSMLVLNPKGKSISCSCAGIYDVEFRTEYGEPYLHCCIWVHLTRVIV